MKKLSTVILNRTKGIKQGYYDMKDADGTYCVLGAVSKAVGIEPRVGQIVPGSKLKGVFPVLKEKFTLNGEEKSLATVLIYLNDTAQWTFKRIGNWLKKRGF